MRSVTQAALDAKNNPTLPPVTYSHFMVEIVSERKPIKRRSAAVAKKKCSSLVRKTAWRKNLTTDTATGYTNRRDWQAKAMGMGPSFAGTWASGAATATTGTTLTAAGTFPTAGQGLAGQIVACGPNSAGTGTTVYGVIVSNTATVLTVDQWYNPQSAVGAAGTTPNATCTYQILPGQNPASWLAVTSDATAPSASDTALASEATTNGFARAVGSYSHTAAATTYALVKTFTATGTLTVNKEAVFGAASPTAGGVMPFESAETSPPTLVSGDTLAQTVTVTIN